jgi:hypothetical protein
MTGAGFLLLKTLMKKQFIEARVEKKNDRIIFIASDESIDRHGESLDIEKWDLKNFKKNPVLLAEHWPAIENIVGKAKKIWIEGKKLLFEPQFHEITEMARTVKAMVEEGVLQTVSVGFIPKENSYELLEISFVAIPANANARMQKALEVKPNAHDIEKIKDFIGQPNMAAVLDSINDLKQKTQSIESLLGSMARPVPKQQVIKARRVAKLTVNSLSGLNSGLRNLLQEGGVKL